MRVLIAGAGIGGLVTAILLFRSGHDVEVFESVPQIEPLGVGINLLPHAVAVLDRLGLSDQLSAIGVPTSALAYHNRHGQQIWREPRGKAAGYAVPQISIHRGRLQMALLDAARTVLGPERISTGRRLDSFSSDQGVSATFIGADGKTHAAAGDILVAADGIHSIVRRTFYPDEGLPLYSGRLLWRATTRQAPFLDGSTMIMAGHRDQKLVAYPLEPVAADGTQLINWIAELRRDNLQDRESWNKLGQPHEFLPAFARWQFDWLDVPALIRGAEQIYVFPMVDRDPLPKWSFGRVTLMGDAAHPMYPIGSNGASQAILDAAALDRALSSGSDPVAALAAYEADRLPATSAIVRANRADGPEQCMQLAQDRAPDGFDRIEDVILREDLEEISMRYKKLAGFAPEQLLVA